MDVPERRQPDAPEFERLRDELFEDLERWPELLAEARRAGLPLVDVEVTDEAYRFDVELPGARADEVTVEITPGRLVVTGERAATPRDGELVHSSRTDGRLRLDVALPVEVDAEAVTARLQDGLLRVHLPKAAPPRRIAVTRRRAG